MALLCAAIRKDSVSLLKFPFRSHVHVCSIETSLVYRWKCPCFYFFWLFLFSWCFYCQYCCNQSPSLLFYVAFSCIDALTLSWMLVSPRPPCFLCTYSLSTSSLGIEALCVVTSFLVKNGPEYLTRKTTEVFIPLMRFPRYIFSGNFLVILRYCFFNFFLVHLSGTSLPGFSPQISFFPQCLFSLSTFPL